MKRKKYFKDTILILMMIFPMAIIAKVIQYTMMGTENFIIMDYILKYLRTDTLPLDKSFAFPIQVYRMVSFLPFNNNLEWSVFFTAIFSVIIFIILLNYKKFNIKQYIFIFASLFIIDLTVLNMNKDLIQLSTMIVIFGIIRSKQKNIFKVIEISMIFFVESLLFRAYYILIAGFVVMIYFIMKYIVGLKKIERKNTVKAIIITMIFMFIGIYITKYISYSAFDTLINRRDVLNSDSITAATKIVDLIRGTGYKYFIINYVINFFRIAFPIELLFKGVQYIPFVIYQLFITINIYKLVKKINKYNIVLISLLLAYYLTLTASESDFGTLVRHQSILLFLYLDMLKINSGEWNYEKN